MYVVFGASGNTGSVVAATLLERGKKVRAVARGAGKLTALRDRGAEIFEGNVEDAASVAAAMQGADEGAYLLMPPDNASNDLLARNRMIIDNYVAGLQQHGVPVAVLLSSVGGQVPSGTGPIQATYYAEHALAKVSGTRFTMLRAAYFMENVLYFAQPMKQDGVLPVFGGGEGYPFAMVATRDIGTVAAEELVSPPAQTGVVELHGPVDYSLDDVAAEATKILGKPVSTRVVPIDALVPTYKQFGISENVANLYREMTEAMGAGVIGWEGKGRTIRGTTPLADVLRAGLTGS